MTQQLIIGTYTESLAHVDGKADGILVAARSNGEISAATVAAEVRNPSWLAVTADGEFLYSVIETIQFHDQKGGGVAAFRRDPETGTIEFINELSSEGTEPAHLALDAAERFVLVANYREGSVAVFRRREDGGLGGPTDVVRHEGSSIHPVRQASPHAHQVVFDPTNGQVLIPDLGLDAIVFYQLSDEGRLLATGQRIDVVPGAGPRHIAFSPDARYLFVLNELDNTLVSLRRDGNGFRQVEVVSTLPAGFSGHDQASAIRVSPDGRVVYVANRGHDTIGVFGFDVGTERLSAVQHESTRGLEPRDFILTSDGTQLIVGNQNSDTLVTFDVDPDGKLVYSRVSDASTPVCLVLVGR